MAVVNGVLNGLAVWRPVNYGEAADPETGELRNLESKTTLYTTMTRVALAAVVVASSIVYFSDPLLFGVGYCGCYVWSLHIEPMRANYHTNQVALQLLRKQEPPHSSVMDHIAKRPRLVSQLTKEELKKIDREGYSVLHHVVDGLSYGTRDKQDQKYESYLATARRFPDVFTRQQLIDYAKRRPGPFVVGEAFNVQAWSEDEQVELLTHIQHRQDMLSLVGKGWDVNVVDTRGKTALTRLLEQSPLNTESILLLLAAGAKCPPAGFELKIGKEGEAKTITVGERLAEKPLLKRFFELGDSVKGLLEEEEKPASLFNLLQPAKSVDDALLRTVALYAVTIAVSAVAFALFSSFGPWLDLGVLLGPYVITAAYGLSEWSRTTKKLDEVAVSSFNSRPIPPHAAAERIVKSRLMSRLDERVLNKVDDKGQTVWETMINDWFQPVDIEVMKTFSKRLFPTLTTAVKSDYFFRLTGDPFGAKIKNQLADYLVEEGLISKSDLTDAQQFQVLSHLQKAEHATKLGLDPNMKNEKGWTPLAQAVSGYNFSTPDNVRALLQAGATLDVKVTVAETPTKIRDLDMRDNIRRIINAYETTA